MHGELVLLPSEEREQDEHGRRRDEHAAAPQGDAASGLQPTGKCCCLALLHPFSLVCAFVALGAKRERELFVAIQARSCAGDGCLIDLYVCVLLLYVWCVLLCVHSTGCG